MSLVHFLDFLLQEEPWRDDAACKDKSTDLFFPKRGQSRKAAKAICKTCPVQVECREYARRSGTHHGIWGGEILSPKQGDTDVPDTLTA